MLVVSLSAKSMESKLEVIFKIVALCLLLDAMIEIGRDYGRD